MTSVPNAPTAGAESQPSARDIYQHACRFYVAIDRMHGLLNNDMALGGMLIPPMLVLTAFASELLLKSQIRAESGQLAMGHDLKALFDRLKPDTQHAVEAEWDKIMVEREGDTRQLDDGLGERVPRELQHALEASKRSFEQLRYLYEGNGGKSFIGFFPQVLNKVIMSLHPDWNFLVYPSE